MRAAIDAARRRAIEWDCHQVLTRFLHYLDARDYDRLAALFAPDGVWIQGRGALRGREQIRATLAARVEPPGLVIRHVVSNIVVDVIDDDGAQATTYLTVYRHDGRVAADGPAPLDGPQMVGVSHNKLVRGAGGWLIAEKRTLRSFERADNGETER